MAYSELADLQVMKATEVLVELSDGTGSTPNATVIAGVIAAADSFIDSKLGPVYTVPFNPVPAVIKTISACLALFYLYGRRQVDIPDMVKTRYDHAIGLLDQIAKGEAGLGVTSSPSSLGPTVVYEKPYEKNKFDMNCLEASDSADPDFIEEDDG